jgi:urease accessory protein
MAYVEGMVQNFRPTLSVIPESVAVSPRATTEQLERHPIAPCDESSPPSTSPPSTLPRSRGTLRMAFKRRDERTVLDTLYQSGCSKMRLPHSEESAPPVAVIINTGGGLTGGDKTDLAVRWNAETRASVSTQAAEKIYRALAGNAVIDNRLYIGTSAEAEWLPQETILFDKAALVRTMRVDIGRGASFLGLESLVFGRTAMGETVRSGHLRDSWTVERCGRLIYSDVLHLSGDIADLLDRPAIGNGARAFATLLLVSEHLTQIFLDALREILGHARGLAAASLWNGILSVRFLAPDGDILRQDVAQALHFLRGGRALPKVWQC